MEFCHNCPHTPDHDCILPVVTQSPFTVLVQEHMSVSNSKRTPPGATGQVQACFIVRKVLRLTNFINSTKQNANNNGSSDSSNNNNNIKFKQTRVSTSQKNNSQDLGLAL